MATAALPSAVRSAATGLGAAIDRVPGAPNLDVGVALFALPVALPGVLVCAGPSAVWRCIGAGFLALATVLLALGWRWRDRPAPTLYLFDRGAVRHLPPWRHRPARVTVFAWKDVLPYERVRSATAGQQQRTLTSHLLTLRTRTGERVLAVEQRHVERAAALIDGIARPRLQARLDTGRLAFGPIVLEADALTVDGVRVPRAELAALRLEGDDVLVTRHHGRTLRVPRRRVPHQRTLVALTGGPGRP